MGSTGDPPIPTGDPPVGTEGRVPTFPDGWFRGLSPLHSVGPVAQRDGQVARATQFHFGFMGSDDLQNWMYFGDHEPARVARIRLVAQCDRIDI